MLISVTDASMVRQPVVSWTEWKCENVRRNNPTITVRLSQTIGLAGCAKRSDEANAKVEERDAASDGNMWLELHVV